MIDYAQLQKENPPRSPFFKGGRISDRVPLFEKEGLGEIFPSGRVIDGAEKQKKTAGD
jgi:hypothetical protein